MSAIQHYLKVGGEIEYGISGCCCPPDERRPGQHTNATTRWWRANGGPWRPLLISSTKFLHAIKHTASVDEFEAKMKALE